MIQEYAHWYGNLPCNWNALTEDSTWRRVSYEIKHIIMNKKSELFHVSLMLEAK